MKNAIAKKNETYITVTPPGEHMERAAKVNYYHNVGRQGASLALEAAFRCGMELFQAKIEHAGTFEQWIEENCEFGRALAYRYLSLVQKAIGADDLPKLANGSEKQRKSAIAEILSESDSKTVTELFCEYGVMKKTPSNLGGKREGAGRPRKEENDAAVEELKKIATDPDEAKLAGEELYLKLQNWALQDGGFHALRIDDKEHLVKELVSFVDVLKMYIKDEKRK